MTETKFDQKEKSLLEEASQYLGINKSSFMRMASIKLARETLKEKESKK